MSLSYLNRIEKYMLDGNKLFWYPERLQNWLDGKRIMPITIDIGIHKGCNIACIFCYGFFQKKSKEFIPIHTLLQLAKDAKKCDIKGIAIVGDGEPTLNMGLYPFVQALTDNNVASAVATNGLLLHSRKIDILIKNCSWIRFNVSAVYERYSDIHKGADIKDFYRLERLIRYAVEHKKKCTIGIQMVLIPQCFDQIIPFAKWAIELGVNYAQIKQFSDPGADIPIEVDLAKYKDAEKLLKEAEGLSNNTTQIKIKWKALKDSRNISMNKKWDFDRCLDLPFLFQISGNGKCYPCGYLFNSEKYCYGDLRENSLYKILNSDRYWAVIKEIANTPMEKLCTGQCRHCSSLQFIDRLVKIYRGNLKQSLIELCGSKEQYDKLMDNKVAHLEFV